MSTSVSEKIELISSTLYGTDDDPVDSVLMRRGVANNLMHMCDSMGQVRVNFWPVLSSYANSLDSYLAIEGPDNTTGWYLFGGMPMGPWPLTLRADGTPYRLIVHMAGFMSSGLGTGTFRLVFAPDFATAREELFEDTDRAWEGSTTATSTSTITGASQGSGAYADYVDIDRDRAAAWIRDVTVYDAVSGAEPKSAQQCLTSAWVFARTTHTGAAPRLSGLRVAEYIAP